MAIITILATNTYGEWRNATNSNSLQIIDTIEPNAGGFKVTRFNGSNFQVNLPNFPNQINSGLVLSSGISMVNYTDGSYQLNNQLYAIGTGGSLALGAVSSGMQRIDAIVVDATLVAPSGHIQVIAGVESVAPVTPTIPANMLLVGYILIDDTGTVDTSMPTDCCIADGTTANQTIRWDGSAWVYTNVIKIGTGSVIADVNTFFSINGLSGSKVSAFQCSAPSPTVSMSAYDAPNYTAIGLGNESGTWQVRLESTNHIYLKGNQGILIQNYVSPPTTVTDKLYVLNHDLYFNGGKVCLNCVGIVIVSVAASSTIASTTDILIVTATGTTQSLPATPVNGQRHKIVQATTAAIGGTTLNGNGHNIRNGNTSTPTYIIPAGGQVIEVIFITAINEWIRY